jgi:hypothetical protein
MNNLGK